MDDAVTLTRHKLDVDEYYRMAEAGILDEDDRVELIDGEIIDMMPIGPGHSFIVNGLTKALVMACGDEAIVSVRNPVRFDRFNEPEPDFAVLRPRADNYRESHPGPADVLLLVEVADSSLRYDRRIKLPLYAEAGIVEYWLVDLKAGRVEVFRNPEGGAYLDASVHGRGERLALAAAPGVVVALDQVFD